MERIAAEVPSMGSHKRVIGGKIWLVRYLQSGGNREKKQRNRGRGRGGCEKGVVIAVEIGVER